MQSRMSANDTATFIIKQIKKGAGGNHGGAWNVACADPIAAVIQNNPKLKKMPDHGPARCKSLHNYFCSGEDFDART